MAAIVSLIVQGIQHLYCAKVRPRQSQAEYQAVKDYRVPDPEEGQLDLAEYRRRRFKSVGYANSENPWCVNRPHLCH
jgi:hypothetical protein